MKCTNMMHACFVHPHKLRKLTITSGIDGMKRIAIDFHFVRNQVATGKLCISNVHTSDQLADSLTKPVPRRHFKTHWNKSSMASQSCGGMIQF
jgi:hypothetical protein